MMTLYFFEVAYHFETDELRLPSVLEVMQREMSRLRQEYQIRYFDVYHQYVHAPTSDGTVTVMLECVIGGSSNENLIAMLEAFGYLFTRIADKWDFYSNDVTEQDSYFTETAKNYWLKKYGCEL